MLRAPSRSPFYVVLLAVVAAVWAIPSAGAQERAMARPLWAGAWAAAGDGGGAGQHLRLEPGRATWSYPGKQFPEFYRLGTAGKHVQLERWGHLRKLQLRVEGDRLTVLEGDKSTTFERLADVPEELMLLPYDLPDPEPLDAETVEFIGQDLLAREAEDQRVRMAGRTSGYTPELQKEMGRVDEDNTEFVRSLIQELGWIDAERFGRRTAEAAFLIVQHTSDMRLMHTALPRIEADVKAGRLGGQSFALMYDRFQLNHGYLQRYGSQLATLKDGESVLMPLEDPDNVDQRRKEMGMGPLAEYLAYFQEEGDPPVRSLAERLKGGARAEPASADR